MKKHIFLLMIILTGISCTDNFLEEKMVSTITQDYFETEQGLEQLIVGTYNSVRMKYGWTDGIYNFEVGHDMGVAQGGLVTNNYSASAWSSTGGVAGNVNSYVGQFSRSLLGLYPVINNCNRAIKTIEDGKAQGKFAKDPKYAASRLAEAKFNRAMCYYQLNTLLGDVYMTTDYTVGLPPSFSYKKSTSKEIYDLMISDLRYGYENLPATARGSNFGRASKYAAAHFLSKLYLQREQGSGYGTTEFGRRADGSIDTSNEKSYLGMLFKGKAATDLDSCIFFATEVIGSGNFELESNFNKLFSRKIGDYSNESSKEIILSAVFGTGTADNTRFGMRAVSYFSCNYVDARWGIPTYCWEYPTQPQSGAHNNDFAYDVYTNKLADSRYQKSFRLEYKTALMGGGTSNPGANLDYHAYNAPANATYKWNAEQAAYYNANIRPNYSRASYGGRTAVVGERKMGKGDLAFAFLENTKSTAIDIKNAQAQPFVLFARWIKDGDKYYYRPQIKDASGTNTYDVLTFYGLETANYRSGQPTTIKWEDPNRTSYNSFYGTRDVIVFRLAETYLIRAEAYGRKEGPTSANAIADINKVRNRAAFKTGEQRAEVLARLYPGSENLTETEKAWPYTVEKDMTGSMLVDATYWNGTSEQSKAEGYPATATTDMQRFINFIYNELGRELNQEMIYYENLHHSGLQADRIQYNNQIASTLKNRWDKADNLLNGQGQDGNGKGSFKPAYTLRPFPETILDMLTDENNKLLTPEAKDAYQNNGY